MTMTQYYGNLSRFLTQQLTKIDADIAEVVVDDSSELGGTDPDVLHAEFGEARLRMTAAMASAARAAGHEVIRTVRNQKADPNPESVAQAKRRIDGAAVSAGERILRKSKARIVVRAGEGVRDDSPGAELDQVFGEATTLEMHAAIDYVDGTGLAALNLPGALSLGALGSEVRRTPDLKAFAVLGPRSVLSMLKDWDEPQALARNALNSLARSLDKEQNDLRVLTHSRDVGQSQDAWYRFLKQNAGDVVVPDPVSVEPPYILLRAHPSTDANPPIDCMIGVMGLVELVYATLLLDLLSPEDAIHFRLVSSTSAKDLMATPVQAFDLSTRDREWADSAGMEYSTKYSSDSFVKPGTASFAAMFGITANPLMALTPATLVQAEGMLVLPERRKLRVRVVYSPSAAGRSNV